MTVDRRTRAEMDEALLPDKAKEAHIDELRATIVRSAEVKAGERWPDFRHIAETLYNEHFGPLIRELDTRTDDLDKVLSDRSAEEELYLLRGALTRIAYAPEDGKLQKRWKRKDWMHLSSRMRMVAQAALKGNETPIPAWGSQKGVLEREIERWRREKNPDVKHLTATYPTERQDRDR